METHNQNTLSPSQPHKASEQLLLLENTVGNTPATKADIARLADRMDEEVWATKSMKMAAVSVACLFTALIGAGGVVISLKAWPQQAARVLRLPVASDRRLLTLLATGADLQVKTVKGVTYLYFGGEVQPTAGQSKSGNAFLYFQP